MPAAVAAPAPQAQVAAHGGAAHQAIGLLLIQPLMTHQAPGLLDEPPLHQLLAQLALGLHRVCTMASWLRASRNHCSTGSRSRHRVRHQQHLLQQGEAGYRPQPLAEQEARHVGPEGEAEAHLGAELAVLTSRASPCSIRVSNWRCRGSWADDRSG